MSAHFRMRRTLLFVVLLLVAVAAPAVSAEPATGSAARSAQTHKKSSAKKSSASAHKSSHARTRSIVKHKNKAAAQPAPSTSKRSATKTSVKSSTPSGATTAYAVGYRNGYDAGRAAALEELRKHGADAKPAPLPAQAAQPAASAQYQEEPSDADPAVDDASTPSLSAQSGPEAEADDGAPSTVMANLELPRAGTPISLRGSLASLQRQNARLESEGLERILDEDDLNSRIAHGLLTPLPVSANLTVNPSLPENRRYCRSWTARFLSDLAKAHAAEFHRSFQVNSAVRTVDYQKRLIRTNGNAAAAVGDVVSPHLTGATIDIGKRGMTRAELKWMRRHLFALQSLGKIDVEEEFQQACFHITVYKTYTTRRSAPKATLPSLREAAAPKPSPEPAPRRHSGLPSSIAAGTFVPQR